MKILPNLDVLRFFLASLVLIQHVALLSKALGLPSYNELPVFHKGTEAVYMFFTLSGFLIIRLIYLEKEKGHFSIKKFYMRRILRIFPLYYLIVVFGFVFNHLILPQTGFTTDYNYELDNAILLTTFFLPNVYADLYEIGAIHQVIWSIGIEEQFYIMIAPFSYFIKKHWLLNALIIFTVGYLILFHFTGIALFARFRMLYFFLFFGGIISVLDEKNMLEFLKTNKIIPLVIIVLTILYYTTGLFNFENLFLKNVTAMLLLGLFIHSISCNNFGVTVTNKAINYLGKVSYGIYMYHISVIYAVLFVFLKVEFLSELNDVVVILLINLLVIGLTIFVSHLSYKYFEMKFLSLKNKFRD
ncbi:acyltransferase [uncultured Winogradskyella sp.]|uniref:acyltransferase family protein n=1 Tax=uncultured Winogradskyella sp. TaxID=395353 RepID=UPI0030DB79FC|tara:strand:+ start:11466 stop:12536 length:1071 start_codon:yes stop_codon:yes gene_type:complete